MQSPPNLASAESRPERDARELRNPNKLLWLGILFALLLGAALRFPQLDARPMHNDEGVNAVKVRQLWEHRSYKYDPQEYHGPTLPYFTWAWMKITGAKDFVNFNESQLRALTVLFGLGLIALIPLIADGLGRKAAICAALLTAISPAMTFYSRYYIHEMLLVFFTFLALAAGWRWWRSRSIGWALLAGAAIGLMQATKETFLLAIVALAGAVLVERFLNGKASPQEKRTGASDKIKTSSVGELETARDESPSLPRSGGEGGGTCRAATPGSQRESFHQVGEIEAPLSGSLPARPSRGEREEGQSRAICARSIVALVAMWLVVAFVLFSSFFTNWHGPVDAVQTYLPWLHRAGGASPHIHPWNFYLERLAWFHIRNGPVWSEALILFLALIGFIVAFVQRPTHRSSLSEPKVFTISASSPHPSPPLRGREGESSPQVLAAEDDARFLRVLALYTVFVAAIYCGISYKTPWCLLNFYQPMILLAGFGAMALLQAVRKLPLQILAGAILLGAAGQLAIQGWRADVDYAADPRNPYVYAQTSTDAGELVALVEELGEVSPQKHRMVIKVMAPANDYGPLQWFLRGFDNVGWWSELPRDPYAPVMIVSTKFSAELDQDKTHIMAGLFQLRPGAWFKLYVAASLWDAHVADKSNHR